MVGTTYIRAAATALVLVAGCGNGPAADSAAKTATPPPPTAAAGASSQRHPDIVEVSLSSAGPDTFDVTVTVSSPYDTPQRYADGWRVLAPDGTVLGEHTLLHDHAGEQPFTRVQSTVEIPSDVAAITVQGRDRQYGYGGQTRTVTVPR